MRTICVGISHDNNSIIITVFYFKVVSNTSSNCMNDSINFFILKISSSLAFSVLITLPLKGKIAWNFLSLPSLAEPPAESPSTNIIHFSQYFYFEQVLTFLIIKCLYVYSSYLNVHLHVLYAQLP